MLKSEKWKGKFGFWYCGHVQHQRICSGTTEDAVVGFLLKGESH